MKKYSHSKLTKFIVFIIMIAFFSGTITTLVKIMTIPFNSVLQKSYFESAAYIQESQGLISDLTKLMGEFKNEENILNGGTISEDELKDKEEELYFQFQNSKKYNPKLSEEENYKQFKKEYADEISHERDKFIQRDLREYYLLLQKMEDYETPLFYASDGTNVYTNTTMKERQEFETYPAFFIFDHYDQETYPKETRENDYLYWITDQVNELDPENTVIYLAFPDKFLNTNIKEWKENSALSAKNLYKLTYLVPGFILSFIYLALVTGRKSFRDQEVHLNVIDKLYNDINVLLCVSLIALYTVLLDLLFEMNNKMILPITVLIAAIGFVLIFSLIKHGKNKTLIKHTLLYNLISQFAHFIGDVYRNGSLAVKTVLLAVGYPLLVALTFFIFPVTLGVAAWFALKKIKSFNAIQAGVEEIKAGNLQYHIDIKGRGEFARLAENINSITDGLRNAVDNELKSERLKTELITNVSHDIRTPLTSIITYVDLLKNEKDPTKIEEYVGVLDQKSKRLKVLTDNLFEAAKASSGDIPVHLEKIDIISLINQGLGEVGDKILARNLEFKLNFPADKLFVTADGRLLWRSIENVLSNIFKYALEGSRVYVDIEDLGNDVRLVFKNISASELNISADELMERFKRGDESRTSEGSGLGLSIAKSLIEIQRGKFSIQIDGDLFKAIIVLPKYSQE
ncbi:HAMP domain-containing sensor histidine kinase [Caldifermentibacillus hisashii]|uniref:HAMP domain-containing sensor histidine kinase n=1 Tax=Caldifermentibacillus hisashii TaxID=996558 RepID=UPI00343A39A4